MKKTILFFVAQFVLWSLFAQNQQLSIKGKILDESGSPLPGASVFLENTSIGSVSDSNGSYELQVIEKGNYVIGVEFLGYKSFRESINVETNFSILNVTLTEEDILLEEVTVEAIRAGESTPFAYSNLKADELKEISQVADIPYLLELTPSVVATSETGTGIGYTGVRIRGTSESRINITINGVPLNDAESLGAFWVNLPDFSSSVNDVQIQRGVGTSSNGSSAFGATINFKTNNLSRDPHAEIYSTFGSFNTFKRSISSGTGLIKEKFAFDMRVSKITSDGYIKRAFVDHTSTYLSGGYFGEKTVVKASVLLGDQRTGISWWGTPVEILDIDRTYNPAGKYIDDNGETQFYDGQTDNYKQNHYQLSLSHVFNKNLNMNATFHTTTGEGYYEQYIPEFDDWDSPNLFTDYGLSPIYIGNDTITETDMIRQKWMENIFYGGIFSLNYSKENIELSFGASVNRYEGDHFGNILWTKVNSGIPKDYEWYRNQAEKTDISGFLKANWFVTEQLNIYADVQQRFLNYMMEGPDDDGVLLDQEHDYSFFNPKFGILFQISDNSKAYLSYALSHREPTRADLKDAVKGSSENNVKYPQPEALHDYELGYSYQGKTLAGGINIYYMNYIDQLVLTGELSDAGYPLMTNVPKSYRAGVELMGGVKLFNKIEWQANMTLSSNKIVDYVEIADAYDENWDYYSATIEYGNSNISYSPEIVAGSILNYNFNKDLTISFISKYVGEQYFDNTSSNDRKIDPYFLQNASIDYQKDIKSCGKLIVKFMVNNLLDTKYSNNAYGGYWLEQGNDVTWAYYYPQAGRHFMVTLGLEF